MLYNEDIFIRLLVTLGLIVAGVSGYGLFNRLVLARARRLLPGIDDIRPGTPTIVYFTTPDCIPCKTIQRPALRKLQERLGGRVQVIEIDATQRPDLAAKWSVMSVPTTFIVDPKGKPRAVNHGVTDANKLYQQLSTLL